MKDIIRILMLVMIAVFTSCSHKTEQADTIERSAQYDELQNKLDSVFDEGTYLDEKIRASFFYENINHVLDEYIKISFNEKYKSDLFRNEKILEYSLDTFRIAETMRFCQERESTTLRMSLCNIYKEEAETHLVDKYYKRLLSKLDSKEKVLLEENQQEWLESYQSDKELSNLLLSKEEGTMYSVLVFSKQEYRIQFLYDCLLY